MNKIEELKAALNKAESEERDARAKVNAASKDLANAIAEALGLSVGCTISETKSIGYGSTRRTREQRYRVESFRYRYYGHIPLTIYGRTIRKDGTIGDKHEVYGNWKVVKDTEQAVTHD